MFSAANFRINADAQLIYFFAHADPRPRFSHLDLEWLKKFVNNLQAAKECYDAQPKRQKHTSSWCWVRWGGVYFHEAPYPLQDVLPKTSQDESGNT